MLLALVCLGIGAFVGQVLVFGLGFALEFGLGFRELTETAVADWLNDLLTLDAGRPLDLAITLGSLAVMVPSALLGYRLAGLRPAGLISSVRARLRWRWLWACLPWGFLTILVALGIGLALDLAAGERLAPVWTPWPTLAASLVVIVLLVPFQAAAEEYVFRGVLVQALGSWLPQRAWAGVIVVLVPTGLFVLGHGYGLWGLADVGAFGLAAMWLVLRTGGLEAAIALHVANNVTIFAVQATGLFGPTTQDPDGGSLLGVLLTVVTSIGYCWVVEVLARRSGIARTSPWPQRRAGSGLPVPVPGAVRVLGSGWAAGSGSGSGSGRASSSGWM